MRQDIHMNISCRYHTGCDKRSYPYPIHPLDEVQENVNIWTKHILLGSDQLSWAYHSPNVAAAHICVNHEEVEYIKSSLDYYDINNVSSTYSHHSKRAAVPEKIIEKTRPYKWCVAMFKYIPGRDCIVKDRYTTINRVKTLLKEGKHNTTTDPLEPCVNNILNDTEDTL